MRRGRTGRKGTHRPRHGPGHAPTSRGPSATPHPPPGRDKSLGGGGASPAFIPYRGTEPPISCNQAAGAQRKAFAPHVSRPGSLPRLVPIRLQRAHTSP